MQFGIFSVSDITRDPVSGETPSEAERIDAIVKIAQDLDIAVKETVIPREMLYIADEVFFVGTAVEVTPIRSVDHIQVGKGSAGPITRRIQEEFFAITSGSKPDRHNWLTPVNATAATPTPVATR